VVWKFNCLAPATYDPAWQGKKLKEAETIASPVFYKNRIYMTIGNDLKDSGDKASPGRLVCIDATKTGDITETGKVWSFDDIRNTACTPAIADGLLYTGDAAGNIYCLDADTGKPYWKHNTSPVWGSPLVADGKVYVPSRTNGMLVFAAGREKKLLSQSKGLAKMSSSPAAANGVLYIATDDFLYALADGKTGGLKAPTTQEALPAEPPSKKAASGILAWLLGGAIGVTALVAAVVVGMRIRARRKGRV
jgi:outer membrane protein assembly factor BamB